jgi:tetratricopeptide (TPR) repeat protein
MKSKGGATLSKLPDESILASGKNLLGDAYTIVAPTQVTQISAIRLEALTHESLPSQGPGRSEEASGSFAILNFKITAHVPRTQPRPIEVSRVAADHYWIEPTVDQWISEGSARPHTAVYLTKQPVDCKGGARLEFLMEFAANVGWRQNLDRFRLSVSRDPAAFNAQQTRFAAIKLTDPWAKLAVAYAVNGRNDEATRYFAKALERSLGREARKPILELAAHFDYLLPALIERQPDEPQLQLALARSLARRGKEHLALKQPATAQTELEKSREILARLRAKYPEPSWTVLKPAELKSERGQTLMPQADGSIRASGTNPDRDTYTLTAPIAGGTVAGLRLESIPDDRLKEDARRYGGEFFLTEIDLAIEAESRGTDRPLVINDGIADFSADGHPLSRAFDQNDATSWGVWPRVADPHTAIFECASSSAATAGNQPLKVRLRSGSGQFPQRNLGRFRLSVTSDARDLLVAAHLRNDLKDSEIADLNIELAKAHSEQGHKGEAMASLAEALPLAADRAGKARIITAAAPLAGALEKLAEGAAGDALFQAELARHFAEHGNAPLAEAARTKARTLFEEKLAKKPENSAWAAELAGLLLPPIDAKTTMTVPTSEDEAVSWRFSTTQPAANWIGENFDDSQWSAAPGSFGNGSAPGLTVRTNWKTSDIWLRRKFEWKSNPAVQTLLLRVIYDDGFELFINGQHVFSRPDYVTSYVFHPLDAKAKSLLKPGTNTMAVHCRSTTGFQYIDVGLHGVSSNRRVTEQRLTAMTIADPWAKLAAAYHATGDRQALGSLVKHHPEAASGVGDLYAASQDWERAIAVYRKLLTDRPADVAVLTKLAAAYQSACRTREAVSYLANASAADPNDMLLLRVAALQAWFGQEQELAATRQRILAFAKDTNDAGTAERAAKACSILPFTNKAELAAALALARKGVELDHGGEWREWRLLALGMAEYRSGNDAAANLALLAAVKAETTNATVAGLSGFYRAMSLFRQGKRDLARKLAIETAAQMQPLPRDEQNPLSVGVYDDTLILWLAYKEAKAMIEFDKPPAPAR